MSWATNSVGDAICQLSETVAWRCQAERLPQDAYLVRTPVALMFVRGDRAEPGATLARTAESRTERVDRGVRGGATSGLV